MITSTARFWAMSGHDAFQSVCQLYSHTMRLSAKCQKRTLRVLSAVGMQSGCHFQKPRFLIAVGNVFDLFFLQ